MRIHLTIPDIAQYYPHHISLNVITASKGSNFCILFAIARSGITFGGDNAEGKVTWNFPKN